MKVIETEAELDALYGAPSPRSLSKVMDRLTPHYRRWIGAARFAILGTVGPGGTDTSPRGDDGPVVQIVNDTTLWMPDWRGNNRLDSLRNIVADGRVSVMFMVPGADNVIRINGRARITGEPAVTGAFERAGRHPRSVIVIEVGEVYFQCAKALIRSGLWVRQGDGDGLPSAGDFLSEHERDFDGARYDADYPEYARKRMW